MKKSASTSDRCSDKASTRGPRQGRAGKGDRNNRFLAAPDRAPRAGSRSRVSSCPTAVAVHEVDAAKPGPVFRGRDSFFAGIDR